jgi:hypothetical protein
MVSTGSILVHVIRIRDEGICGERSAEEYNQIRNPGQTSTIFFLFFFLLFLFTNLGFDIKEAREGIPFVTMLQGEI